MILFPPNTTDLAEKRVLNCQEAVICQLRSESLFKFLFPRHHHPCIILSLTILAFFSLFRSSLSAWIIVAPESSLRLNRRCAWIIVPSLFLFERFLLQLSTWMNSYPWHSWENYAYGKPSSKRTHQSVTDLYHKPREGTRSTRGTANCKVAIRFSSCSKACLPSSCFFRWGI